HTFNYYSFQAELYLLDRFFFQAEDGIRNGHVTGVQTCALPIFSPRLSARLVSRAPDITRLLDKLESRGLIERERSAQNRRIVRRSEERRVGKECGSWWLAGQLMKKRRSCWRN